MHKITCTENTISRVIGHSSLDSVFHKMLVQFFADRNIRAKHIRDLYQIGRMPPKWSCLREQLWFRKRIVFDQVEYWWAPAGFRRSPGTEYAGHSSAYSTGVHVMYDFHCHDETIATMLHLWFDQEK